MTPTDDRSARSFSTDPPIRRVCPAHWLAPAIKIVGFLSDRQHGQQPIRSIFFEGSTDPMMGPFGSTPKIVGFWGDPGPIERPIRRGLGDRSVRSFSGYLPIRRPIRFQAEVRSNRGFSTDPVFLASVPRVPGTDPIRPSSVCARPRLNGGARGTLTRVHDALVRRSAGHTEARSADRSGPTVGSVTHTPRRTVQGTRRPRGGEFPSRCVRQKNHGGQLDG
jgi:hypothetical protein